MGRRRSCNRLATRSSNATAVSCAGVTMAWRLLPQLACRSSPAASSTTLATSRTSRSYRPAVHRSSTWRFTYDPPPEFSAHVFLAWYWGHSDVESRQRRDSRKPPRLNNRRSDFCGAHWRTDYRDGGERVCCGALQWDAG